VQAGTDHVPTSSFTVAGLADAVATGRDVDWQTAEQSAETIDVQETVHQLRILSALSAVYRTDFTGGPTVTHWGRFESLVPIGSGTYGTVYQCWDPLLERPVALKLLHAHSADDRALTEARLLAKVHHQNVVTVYGADRVEGRLGLWMELLAGRSLKEEVAARRRLSERDAAHIGAQLCRGLAAVHNSGLVHGDVKAQNVIQEPDGRVVLTDFGAGVNHDAAAHAAPAAGGTPYYMAPELFEGSSVSVRSDVYSVGVLLFYLATGEFPVVAGSHQELAEAHAAGRRRRVATLRPDLSTEFAAIVERAMAVRPDERCGRVPDLQAALERVLAARDRGRSRPWRVMTWSASLVAAIVLGLVVLLTRAPSGTANVVKAIAVLPFANLSGNADEEYLADGLTDMLTSNLAQLNALRVTSRTSAMRYKNTQEPVANIGRALHVDALVEGSMMHANGHVRVIAQVIRVSTDEHVWARTFERGDGDFFALQAEIASAISAAIKVAVSPAEHTQVPAHIVNAAAQDAYLRGRYLIEQQGRDGNMRALVYLKRAVALDPSYARAFAALARCYIILANFGEMTHVAAYKEAYEATERAIALDDRLADAHSELADLLLYERWDWQSAAQEYQRAIELNASHALARSHYSRYLSAVGRHDAAIEQARLTVDGDPLSIDALEAVPLALLYAARYAEAIAGFREALRLFPNTASIHFGLGRALAAAGEFDAAGRELDEAAHLLNGYVSYRLEAVRVLIASGHAREGLERLRAIKAENTELPAVPMAGISGALGERDNAFRYLNRAVQERSPNLLWASVDPRLTPLRGDPRFPEILRALGIP